MVPATGGWQCAWRIIDHTGARITDSWPGDYLGAEAILLAATAELDAMPGS